MPYSAPLHEMIRTLDLVGFQALIETGNFPHYDDDLLEPILDEANKLARDVIAPLNQVGHEHGAILDDGGVRSSPGFKEAFQAYRDGGWMGLSFPEEWGGQGLPKTLGLTVMEMINSANMAFGLCPMLSFGAIEAILAHGTDEQKKTYLPKLISADWTGTMNLTEPQAGSDVGALKTKAVPNSDGSYSITGQKIFITWGDHDLAENIIHLVLARTPGAPEGSKGISLFLCPKYLISSDGSSGEPNNVKCIGLEKKMGIHASPTCVMEYDGAVGWLLGQENQGLACMFTMMNSARLQVGIEGASIAEAAFQEAAAYAQERKQGKAAEIEGAAPIVYHADVQRMLIEMKARTAAARAICYACAIAADTAETASDETTRQAAKEREDLLTPIAKAWSTDVGVDVASIGVQVHGGMGFMSETLAAQLYTDARIGPIYEGTNGVQAIDLVGRKIGATEGRIMHAMIDEIRHTARRARATNKLRFVQIADHLDAAVSALAEATVWMVMALKNNRDGAMTGATNYLSLAGDVIGGHFLTLSALAAQEKGSPDQSGLLAIAAYFSETALAAAPGKKLSVTNCGDSFLQDRSALFELELAH